MKKDVNLKRSNKQKIRNAISKLLEGTIYDTHRKSLLNELDSCLELNYAILLKSSKNLKFQGLYSVNIDLEQVSNGNTNPGVENRRKWYKCSN